MAMWNTAPSRLKQQLIQAVSRGEPLDLAGGDQIDEVTTRLWGPGRRRLAGRRG